MRFKDNESGQTLAITALCMVGFMGFVALGVDVGVLFHTRWELQTAADAAATAAAVEYLHNGYSQSGAITAGTAAATANNVNDGNTMTASVTKNANANSPGAHKFCPTSPSTSTCYFEAIVSKPNPTVFYRAFVSIWKGSSSSAFTVSARAVAGTPGNATGCAYLTAATGTALTTQGKWNIDATGCGIIINSNSSSVENDTGNANKAGIDAASIGVVGPLPNDITTNGGATPTHVLPQTIPFTNFTPPTPPTTCSTSTSLSGTLTAGCYSGNNISIGTATLGAGTYYFTGSGIVTINGAVDGTAGVTLDIISAGLEMTKGNSALDLTPPTTGTFNGVSIYMPLANASQIKFDKGSSTSSIGGFIVAPGAELSLQDNGGSTIVDGLVIHDIDTGPASLTINGYSAATSPLKYVALVE